MAQELPTQYQQFIHRSRYARFRDDLGRRETWEETVDRYLNYITDQVTLVDIPTYNALRLAILNTEVLPSMRAMMTAGAALDRCNVAGYNCAYTPIDDPARFSEILYVLMCGTGMGFSCERQEIVKLPVVPNVITPMGANHMVSDWAVQDSKEGWAESLAYQIKCLYAGGSPLFGYDNVRPAGARLKTFGGRASGPAPLKELHEFVHNTFMRARGRKLTSIEVHDIVCKIGEVVVVGGVRRSALISLSNLSDDRMAKAKAGQWWETEPQRALANNSAVYDGRPEVGQFMREWLSLYDSKSGERGIFNREAANMLARRVGRDTDASFGTNPCSEIILRPQQFCNLTEIVVRHGDTVESMKRKIRLATILGTLQARLVDFKFLSKEWHETTKREALLGVSMTGIYDGPSWTEWDLAEFRSLAVDVNRVWAEKLGINPAASITCVKPSGTVSQLADCASGIHPRHSPYYIRRVRGDIKDPLTLFLMEQGVPWEPCAMKPGTTAVFSFPQRAPEGHKTRDDVTPVEHLQQWLKYQKFWCDHKPSVTISVRENEWPTVGAWVWENFDWMSGVSFLPHSDHTYVQAPYEECDEKTYKTLLKQMPNLDWSKLPDYEKEDTTRGSQTMACTAGSCEIVDLT